MARPFEPPGERDLPGGNAGQPPDAFVTLLRSGERDAFIRFFETHRLSVFGLVRCLVPADEAAAVVNETFVVAYRQILLDDGAVDLEARLSRAALAACREHAAPAGSRGEALPAGALALSDDTDLGRRFGQALRTVERASRGRSPAARHPRSSSPGARPGVRPVGRCRQGAPVQGARGVPRGLRSGPSPSDRRPAGSPSRSPPAASAAPRRRRRGSQAPRARLVLQGLPQSHPLVAGRAFRPRPRGGSSPVACRSAGTAGVRTGRRPTTRGGPGRALGARHGRGACRRDARHDQGRPRPGEQGRCLHRRGGLPVAVAGMAAYVSQLDLRPATPPAPSAAASHSPTAQVPTPASSRRPAASTSRCQGTGSQTAATSGAGTSSGPAVAVVRTVSLVRTSSSTADPAARRPRAARRHRTARRAAPAAARRAAARAARRWAVMARAAAVTPAASRCGAGPPRRWPCSLTGSAPLTRAGHGVTSRAAHATATATAAATAASPPGHRPRAGTPGLTRAAGTRRGSRVGAGRGQAGGRSGPSIGHHWGGGNGGHGGGNGGHEGGGGRHGGRSRHSGSGHHWS